MGGRRRRWLVRIALAAIAAVVCLLAVSWGRAQGAWAIVQAPNYGRGTQPPQLPPSDVDRVVRADVGPPTAMIEAWVLDPIDAPRGTILVLHGIRDQKASMIGVGRAIRERGMRAILVDLRGHGGSSGQFLTYGVLESRDLAQLVDQLDALGMLEGPLGVYGPSYGGAVALQLAAIEPRVRAVASVSTFSSLRDVVPPYASLAVPGIGELLPRAVVDAVVDDAGDLGGFSPDAANTRAAIARTDAKVLLIHGRADRHIPFEHARALFRACASERCELMPIEGADHPGALGSERAREAALDFLEEHAAAPRAVASIFDR